MLVSTAVDIITQHLTEERDKGLAVVIQRNSLKGKKIQTDSLVEILWSKEYP